MTPFWFDRHSENLGAGEGHLALLQIDEADAGFEPVIGLALILVLAEQGLHPAMQAGEHLARIIVIGAAKHAVEQSPGNQSHKGAGNTMAGAIADHHRVAVGDRLKPEKVAANDVARLPD